MLRRDADCAYWTGRYVERAESTARMIDVHYHFCLESPLEDEAAGWASILEISGLEDDFRSRYGEESERNILHFFAFDPENPSSILSCLRTARENARSIRDQISSEMFECLNRSYLEMREWDVDRVLRTSPFAFFRKVKDGSHLFQGITARTLMLGESRDFLETGKHLERADQTARILDVKYHDLVPVLVGAQPPRLGTDMHGWTAVLKSVGAFEAYRKTYRDGVLPEHVAEFLVLSPAFPASVRHSIGQVEFALKRISGNMGFAPSNEPERLVGRLNSDLTYLGAPEILSSGLHEFLEGVQSRCAEIGDAIWRIYLSF